MKKHTAHDQDYWKNRPDQVHRVTPGEHRQEMKSERKRWRKGLYPVSA